jgi:hypothetical protein
MHTKPITRIEITAAHGFSPSLCTLTPLLSGLD